MEEKEYQIIFQDASDAARGKVRTVSVEVMRGSDARCIAAGTDSKELMRRAGEAIFLCADWRAPVAIVCGKGNNAGDGYVAALYLQAAGIGCELVLLDPDRFSEDGRYYYSLCMEQGVKARLYADDLDFSAYGSVLDCLLGTGFRGEPAGAMASVIEKINSARADGCYVVSADINSGLNGDSGEGPLCVVSDLTVSIGSFKRGLFTGRAPQVIGQCVNADIGIPVLDYYVYLLECADGSFYCGMTNDLDRRLAAHNAGRGGHYTASRRPCRLAWSEYCGSKSDALRRELQIKKLDHRQRAALIMR